MKTFTRNGITMKVLAHFCGKPGDWTSGDAKLDIMMLIDLQPRERYDEALTLWHEVRDKMKGKTLKDWRELAEGEI